MSVKPDYLCTLYDIVTREKLEDFYDLGGTLISHPEVPNKKCLYIRTHPDSKVLAVGHTDHVKFTHNPKLSIDKSRIKAGQLDDRLGLWVILSLLAGNLPKDMHYDVLLTDCEETSSTTAALFDPPEGKQYNWIFEFDRHGSDVVMYDFETKELKELLKSYDFEVGRGSFSDIAVMDRLGCAAFNFGTCYHNEHTDNCHADLRELVVQCGKFRKFFTEQYNNHLIGDTEAAKKARGSRTSWMYPEKKGDVAITGGKSAPFCGSQNARSVVGS